MALKVTYTRGDGGTSMIELNAAGDAKVADVARQLFAADPTRRGATPPEDLTVVVTPQSAGGGPRRGVDPEQELASAGIRSGDHIELTPAAQAAALAEVQPSIASVTIFAGPDKGAVFPLRPGSNVVGRDPDVAVRLTDPLASKRHARIVVGDHIEVVDMGSTNGVMVGDAFVTRAKVLPGDKVVIGDTELAVQVMDRSQLVPPTSATVPFTRSPRVVPPMPEEKVELPEPPAKPTPRQFPRTALVAPVLLGVTMYFVTGRLMSLIFVAMTPLMLLGSFFDSRLNQKRDTQQKMQQFDADLEVAERTLVEKQSVERQVRLERSPAVHDVVEANRTHAPLLWTHRPEHSSFLTVRVGLGTAPSVIEIESPSLRDAVGDSYERASALKERFAHIADVPITADLRVVGGLGVAGPDEAAAGLTRALMVQAAGLHSPMELVITGFVAPSRAAQWRWLEWLPHTSSPVSPVSGDHVVQTRSGAQRLLTELEGIVAARSGRDIGELVPEPRGALKDRADELERPLTPAILVMVHDDSPADRPRLIRLAEKGADVNVHVLWTSESVQHLPAACRTFVEVGGDGAIVGHVRRGSADSPVHPETLTVDEATDFARRLACVEDVGVVSDAAADVPSAVSYLDLHGFEALEPGHHEQQWRSSSASVAGKKRQFTLRALVGHAGAEPFYLDLKSQGPHALVGGTTGAGKSEFLQAWILGMASAYGPDRVTFLFVDYKGGSAFADCVGLPHSVGLVTDLTPHLVDRALPSLRAELHYRERLLEAKGAKDLEALDKMGDPDPPPSLVIVIDEFAALVQEVPAFVDGVVDIAQRGRSLGLHLIMATQRPAGVIKDNLRANTNLRIALRMADEADSSDILGVPSAAHVDPSLQGRAMARMGPGRLSTFQSAYAGGHSVPGGVAKISVRELALGAGEGWEPVDEGRAASSDGESDAARVVKAMAAAAQLMGLPEPRRPWLDELKTTYELSELSKRASGGAAFGLIDDPAHQAQHVATYDPDADRNVLILGGAGAGKSTALRSIAVGSTLAKEIAPVHVYALDAASGALDMLRPLPNVSDVVAVDDMERVGRMMRRLVETVRERLDLFNEARASSLTQYRQKSGQRGLPRILLLVDGYGTFQSDYMLEPGRMQIFSDFQEILQSGHSVGVHAVLTADRVGALHTTIQALISRTIVLRLSDENQYGMVGLRKTMLGPDSPPGRGVDVATHRELQFAVCGGQSRIDVQARAIEQLAAKIPDREEWKAAPIPRMPSLVLASEMPADVGGLPVLAVESESLAPIGFETERSIIIAGQAGTGRTNALAWLATSIHRTHPQRRIVHITQRRTSIGDLPVWAASFVGDAAGEEVLEAWGKELEKVADPETQVVLCIENAQDFGASFGDSGLVQAVKNARRNGHLVIGEAETQSWSGGQLVNELKGARRGLLLAPDGPDAQMLFQTAAPRLSRADMPPGRAVWVENGKVALVQVPLVDGEYSPDR